ncbi:MAG: CAP domain-containing protein [Clostridiales bacterium]|nr:CAP domain-containing protein [Clostridiales bacterium]
MNSKKSRIIIISSVVIAVELIVLLIFVIKDHKKNNVTETTTSQTTVLPVAVTEQSTELSTEMFTDTATETQDEASTTEPVATAASTEKASDIKTTVQQTTKKRTGWTGTWTTVERTTRQKITRVDDSAYRASLENCDEEILRLINIERKKYGLKPLKASKVVSKAAKIRAKELSVIFDHQRPLTGKSFYSSITDQGYRTPNRAENLAAGQDTAKEVVDAWMNCEEHRVNILNPVYTHIGTACYYNPATKYKTYWDQILTDDIYTLN